MSSEQELFKDLACFFDSLPISDISILYDTSVIAIGLSSVSVGLFFFFLVSRLFLISSILLVRVFSLAPFYNLLSVFLLLLCHLLVLYIALLILAHLVLLIYLFLISLVLASPPLR